MKNKLNITSFLLIAFVSVTNIAFSAEYIFDSETKNLNINDELKIDLNINTEGETANAFEGRVIYPNNLLEIKEIRDGDSIVNFWIDRPNNIDKRVVFSGITPGGYMGSLGNILSVVFVAKSAGDGRISVENGRVLRNDGAGSDIVLKITDFNFTVNSQISENQIKVSQINDVYPPETFLPEISRDLNLLDNKWFVAFFAEDKESGIDRFEVKESRYRIFNFSKWTPAVSPYVLNDQELRSYVFVKAIDKTGKTRIIKLSPENPVSWYANIEDWFIIVLIVVVVFVFYRRGKYKIKIKR